MLQSLEGEKKGEKVARLQASPLLWRRAGPEQDLASPSQTVVESRKRGVRKFLPSMPQHHLHYPIKKYSETTGQNFTGSQLALTHSAVFDL